MNVKTLQLGFYILFLVGVTVLFYFIAAPYIAAIFLALITAVLFKTFHQKVLKTFSGRRNLAAFVSVLVVIIIISVPLVAIGNLLIIESSSFYINTKDYVGGTDALNQLAGNVDSFVQGHVPGLNLHLDGFLNFGRYAEQMFVWITGNLAAFFSGILKLTLSAFLYVLCLFYLFRDGAALTRNVLAWSPLFDVHDTMILNKISSAVKSVLLGQLMVGLIQGFLTGVGFWIFGVSNPVIWGTVAAVASLMPAIGTSLVNIPAIIYLFVTGDIMQGLGLAVWAGVAVGLVDNLVGPYLINRGVQIHPFLILISVLGGIGLFGPIGFIAGPVVLSLLFALLELYPNIIRGKTEHIITS